LPTGSFIESKHPWTLSFDRNGVDPENVVFDKLVDWTSRPEEGIKYYSGIANYHNIIKLPENIIADKKTDVYIDLGEVNNLARIHVKRQKIWVLYGLLLSA